MNPTAGQVAIELRRLADSLDAAPDAEIVRAFVFFSAKEKEHFMALARCFPRPFDKQIEGANGPYPIRKISYHNDAVFVWASAPLAITCEIIEPAKPAVYRCDPLLSDEEEASISTDTL